MAQVEHQHQEKRRRRSKPKPTKVAFEDYIKADIRLTASENEDCLDWIAQGGMDYAALLGYVTEGIKLSLSSFNDGATYTATYTITDAGLPDAGYMVSAYAPDPATALAVLFYKLYVVIGDKPISQVHEERRSKRSTIA